MGQVRLHIANPEQFRNAGPSLNCYVYFAPHLVGGRYRYYYVAVWATSAMSMSQAWKIADDLWENWRAEDLDAPDFHFPQSGGGELLYADHGLPQWKTAYRALFVASVEMLAEGVVPGWDDSDSADAANNAALALGIPARWDEIGNRIDKEGSVIRLTQEQHERLKAIGAGGRPIIQTFASGTAEEIEPDKTLFALGLVVRGGMNKAYLSDKGLGVLNYEIPFEIVKKEETGAEAVARETREEREKKITRDNFEAAVDEHQKWRSGKGGRRLVVPPRADLMTLVCVREDLSDAVFENVDLSSSEFKDCVFNRTDFSGADLRDSLFSRCKFRDASFAGADLRDVEFEGCELINVDLEGSRRTGAKNLVVKFRNPAVRRRGRR